MRSASVSTRGRQIFNEGIGISSLAGLADNLSIMMMIYDEQVHAK